MGRRRRADADGEDSRRVRLRIGATAPRGVVVARGDDDLPPHNALRFCHVTPDVNGCAVPLRGPQGRPAPVTSGDPDVAKTGVVAHGAHGVSSIKE